MNNNLSNKIVSAIIWLFVISMFILPCALPLIEEYSYLFEDMFSNPFDYARITDVEYTAVLVDEPDSEGKIIVTERLTFDIHAASRNNPFWELWRDLPEGWVDGVYTDYEVLSVKQIMPDGTEVVWEESPKLYWDDYDYVSSSLGPGKWYHSEGPYNESMRRYECLMFYIDGVYREEMVFEIEYEMTNVALKYNDCSDFYIPMHSGSQLKYYESFKAQILIPNEDMPSPGNYSYITYGTNSNTFPVTESATANPGYYTFSFELDEDDLKFRPYNQYIEFDLIAFGDDKHIFTDYAPENDYTYDNVLEEIRMGNKEYEETPTRYSVIKIIILLLSLVASALIIVYTLARKSLLKTKYNFYEPHIDMEYFRDIPSDLDPNFAAALAFCKHKPPKDDSGVYSAILLSLARKKYIELQEWNPKEVQIIINKNAPKFANQFNKNATDGSLDAEEFEPLTTCEEYYYNLLVRHASSGSILMNTFQYRVSSDYANTDTFVRNMDSSVVNIGTKQGYFQKADYTQPKKQLKSTSMFLTIVGILIVAIFNIISYYTRVDFAFGAFFIVGFTCIGCSIYLRHISKQFILLTQFGVDEYEKWRGLYNFLNSETLMKERTYIELPIWERYLVYATAFGLSKKVIDAIKINCPEASASPVLGNSYYRSSSFHSSGRSFRSAVRSGSSAARASGGYGGGGFGGGYSGGRGGGSGGGGH